MKTSLTLVGFLLFMTGAMALVAGALCLILSPQLYAIIVLFIVGVIAIHLGNKLMQRYAVFKWRGQRRPHITHKMAR